MELRALGRSGLSVSALGLGCMGMSEFYAGRDEDEAVATIHHASIAVSRSSTPRTCTGSAATKNWSDGRSAAAATRWCWRQNSAPCAARKAEFLRYAEIRPMSAKRAKRASSGSGSGLSTSIISIGSIRTRRSRRRWARWPTWCARARCVTGLSEAAGNRPPRGRRAPDRRPAERIFAVEPRSRGRILTTCASSASALSPTARSAAASSTGADSTAGGSGRRRLRAAQSPRFQGENFAAQSRAGGEGRRDRRRKGCTPAQLALAWVLAKGEDIVADPRHQAPPLSRREFRRARHPPDSAGSSDARQRGAAGRGGGSALFRARDAHGQPLETPEGAAQGRSWQSRQRVYP